MESKKDEMDIDNQELAQRLPDSTSDETYTRELVMKEANEIINQKRDQKSNELHTKTEKALDSAISCLGLSLPVCTVTGFSLLMHGIDGIRHPQQRMGLNFDMTGVALLAGIPACLFGPVVDVAKLPILLAASGFKLAESGIYKIKSEIHDKQTESKKEHKIMEMGDLIESFRQRFLVTADLLIFMNLETIESINKKIEEKNKNLISLFALTLLLTAFASRFLSEDNILMSNNRILQRSGCPKEGIEIFNQVAKLKKILVNAKFNQIPNEEASPIIKKYIPYIKTALDYPVKIVELEVELKEVDHDTSEIIKNVIRSLYDIRYEVETSGEVKQQVIKSLNNEMILADRSTGFPLGDNVAVGKDGFLYNWREDKKDTYFTKYEGSLYATDPRKFIDPITGEKIKLPVIANDGYMYNKDTIETLQHYCGINGTPILGSIKCYPYEWPKTKFRKRKTT